MKQQAPRSDQKKQRSQRKAARILFLLFCCAVFVGIGISLAVMFLSHDSTGLEEEAGSAFLKAESQTESQTEKTQEETQETVYEPASVSLIAVGDNLIHNTLLKDASNGDGTYDFTPFYQNIKPYVEAADIAVINQESPLGTGEASGYPSFNTPQACGDALVDTGFDVVSHANNHAMDSGSSAVYDTLDFWDKYESQGILRIGISRSAEDRAKVRYLERNGLKIGFLAYTYGLNGASLPDSNPDLVSLIDKDKIASEMAAVKEECDAVVVLMHWGEEYELKENSEQQELAKFLAENGATLIIGSHPHVCEPCGWVEADNGNRAFCLYSTGNFISAQNKQETMVEAMLQVTITRKEDGTIEVENPGIMPLVCYFNSNWRGYRVLPMDDYTQELAASHALSDQCDMSPSGLRAIAEEVYGDYLISKTIPTTYDTSAQNS